MWNIKENTFCVETCILATSLQEIPVELQFETSATESKLGVSWYRNGSTSFVIWGQWMKVSHQGKSTTRQQVTIEQVVPSVQQNPKSLMIWPRAQAHRQNDSWRIMKEDGIDFIFTWINIFFLHDPSQSRSTDCARCQMDLTGLCWTEAATCSIVVVWWSDLPWWLTFIHCPQITKLVDQFLYQLTPRVIFSCRCFN